LQHRDTLAKQYWRRNLISLFGAIAVGISVVIGASIDGWNVRSYTNCTKVQMCAYSAQLHITSRSYLLGFCHCKHCFDWLLQSCSSLKESSMICHCCSIWHREQSTKNITV